MKNKIILSLRIIAAVIFIQTLYFKFSGAEESKFIFSTLGLEPWGRWGSGVAELIASVLLLIPRTHLFGAIMGLGIISGALLSHLFVLGVVVQDDGGLLFGLACAVFACCAEILILQRAAVVDLLQQLRKVI
jgi:uncharacterized membrane protein YphA (DoxX/SURF4 family)